MPNIYYTISLAEARNIVDEVLKAASADGGLPIAVAVVDASARLIAFAAQDGVAPASLKLSQSKAYSAVVGHQDTSNWASKLKNAETIDFDMHNWTDPNFSGFTGGIILKNNGQVIGGIGVSGRKGKRSEGDYQMQDNELAIHGKNLLKF